MVGFKFETMGEIKVDLGMMSGSLVGRVALLRCLERLPFELDLVAAGNVADAIVTSLR